MDNITSLTELWTQINKVTKQNFPANELQPILGNGKANNPRFMIVFINPTKRNISSAKSWKSIRYPFIGRKRPWVEFFKSGLIDDSEMLNYIMNNESNWNYEFTEKMNSYLEKKKLFITNIVKNTSQEAILPDSKAIKLYLPYFLKEIELVDPKYIITFGLIPFNALVKEKLKLKDYCNEIITTKNIKPYEITVNNKNYKVIPCIYPIGRGNPKQAVEMLKIINESCY